MTQGRFESLLSVGHEQCLSTATPGLEISSSTIHALDRNFNTGEESKFARNFVAATNAILHDGTTFFRAVLPVMPSK